MSTINKKINQKKKAFVNSAFTIVELLVVIVVIGILASITIVSYRGITQKATASTLQADLANASKQLKLYQAANSDGNYPTAINCTNPTATELCIKPSGTNSFTGGYTVNNSSSPKTFTLIEAASDGTIYNVTDSTGPTIASPYIQTITVASCPTTRTQVQDARDSHTYWVQKLADGKCWMLTNLGYAGSGTNTYGDIRTLTNGTGGGTTFTVASYYVTPSTTNFTTEPTAPSTSTDSTGQYGYLYNWCAAMGGQATAACANATTPAPITTTSICPSGWRLPTGNGGEFGALNTAINGGSTTTDAGLIGTPWLAQRGGNWYSGFGGQGSDGQYWSSTQGSDANAYIMGFDSDHEVYPTSSNGKNAGFAVRCVAV